LKLEIYLVMNKTTKLACSVQFENGIPYHLFKATWQEVTNSFEEYLKNINLLGKKIERVEFKVIK